MHADNDQELQGTAKNTFSLLTLCSRFDWNPSTFMKNVFWMTAAAIVHQHKCLKPPAPSGIEPGLSVHNINCQIGDKRSERERKIS